MVESLLKRNVEWSARVNEEDPTFFPRLAAQQKPEFFWIGCSDSRVPANVVAGLDPGEIFVHRNVANVIHPTDLNMLSTLEYSVEVLGVREVIVCGHYGCGGVKAASEELADALSAYWLAPIRRLAETRREELQALPEGEERLNRLAELNVLAGVRRVTETPIMQQAWKRGQKVAVHGMIYGLADGRLRDLGCTVRGA